MSKIDIKDAIYGLAVGDALGVPYEFKELEEMILHPCTDMIGYGSYANIPEGTWSDDTALTLALMGSINEISTFDSSNTMNHFRQWLFHDKYTATKHGVFDCGMSTRGSITNGYGNSGEYSNGNGSLMRIIPMAYYLLREENAQIRWDIVAKCSALTHGHIRSQLCCFFYVEFARFMLLSNQRSEYKIGRWINKAFDNLTIITTQFKDEELLIKNNFTLNPSTVKSSTYVLDTLNAAFYCFKTTTSYKECVLKAVNLGEDTDTTAAIAGALAGIYYSYDSIPKEWIEKLKNKELIDNLCNNWKYV